ncbi:ankyrin [Cadophora sp. DSE1049]|nr:ankyrin [Cadophora sp. DSE1049]
MKVASDHQFDGFHYVSDVTVVLAKALYLERVLRKESHDDFLRHLRILRQRSENDLQKLQALLADHIVERYPQLEASDHDHKVQIKFSKRGCVKYAGKARSLHESLRDHRKSIDEAMSQLSGSAVLQTLVKLNGLAITTTEILEVLIQNQNTSSEQLQVTQENLLPTLANIEGGMQRLLEFHISKAATPSAEEETQPEDIQDQVLGEDTDLAESNETSTTPTQEEPNPWKEKGSNSNNAPRQTAPSTTSTSSTISIRTTLYASSNCDPFCGCQCHTLSVARFPSWMEALIGSLSVGYSGIPQEGEVLVKATYFFPTWFLSRMITVIDRWNSIDGHDIVLKAPRVVSSSADIFVMAQEGNIRGLQEIFSQRRASIYDVSEGEGRSALHFALTAKRAEVCAFLLSQRISLMTEDKNMLSPVDLVWNYLLQDSTTTDNIAIREAFGSLLDESNDLLKRGFSALHRIIFGLSTVDIEDHLRLTTADIDMRCSLGRTPLCWAALRRDANHVRSLVKFGATLDLADIRGQSPFHFATETGVVESLKVLLAAAARSEGPHRSSFPLFKDNEQKDYDGEFLAEIETLEPLVVSSFCRELIERKDYKGRTPLHFATRVNHIEHSSLLLHYGADVNSPDGVLGRTPLHLAIYWNSHEVLSLLLSKNARTDVIDTRKCSVLHYAGRFGDATTLDLLSEVAISGISPEYTDIDGRTPLEAFDLDRPSYVIEDAESAARNRDTFQRLLHSIKLNLYFDSDQSDLDIFFDAASSLEASIASLAPPPLVDEAVLMELEKDAILAAVEEQVPI